MALVLDPAHKDYLLGRGYTDAHISREIIFSVGAGESNHQASGISFFTDKPLIVFGTRSMSGGLAGLHTACSTEKQYGWHQHSKKPYLPILYGDNEDFQLLYEKGSMILTEGVFDRIAVKRSLEDHAVFARLSKGVSTILVNFIKRYANRLIFAFDMDDAGKEAVLKAGKALKGLDMGALLYASHDPADYLKKVGIKKMEQDFRDQIECLL